MPREPSSERTVYASNLDETLKEGDLVIWSGKKLDDMAIRCCTQSEFNHIAIIIRRQGELELLEATGGGVSTCPLEFYVEAWYWSHFSNIFHKVAVRQLHTKAGRGLTKEMRAALNRYAAEMMGTSYQKNPLEYVMATLHRAELLEHKEDFSSVFCSHLVAGAYKALGILPEKKPANTYFPGDFTARHKLKLVGGAWLGKEKNILFREAPAGLPALQKSLKASVVVQRLSASSKTSTTREPSKPTEDIELQGAEPQVLLSKMFAAHVLRKWIRATVRERRRRAAEPHPKGYKA